MHFVIVICWLHCLVHRPCTPSFLDWHTWSPWSGISSVAFWIFACRRTLLQCKSTPAKWFYGLVDKSVVFCHWLVYYGFMVCFHKDFPTMYSTGPAFAYPCELLFGFLIQRERYFFNWNWHLERFGIFYVSYNNCSSSHLVPWTTWGTYLLPYSCSRRWRAVMFVHHAFRNSAGFFPSKGRSKSSFTYTLSCAALFYTRNSLCYESC